MSFCDMCPTCFLHYLYKVSRNIMSTSGFAEQIKAARIRSGMSQEEMAHEMGLSLSTYGRFERGETDNVMKHLVKMAEVLKVEVVDILAGGHVTPVQAGVLMVSDNFEQMRQQLIEEHKAELAEKDRIINSLLKLLADKTEKTD